MKYFLEYEVSLRVVFEVCEGNNSLKVSSVAVQVTGYNNPALGGRLDDISLAQICL